MLLATAVSSCSGAAVGAMQGYMSVSVCLARSSEKSSCSAGDPYQSPYQSPYRRTECTQSHSAAEQIRVSGAECSSAAAGPHNRGRPGDAPKCLHPSQRWQPGHLSTHQHPLATISTSPHPLRAPLSAPHCCSTASWRALCLFLNTRPPKRPMVLQLRLQCALPPLRHPTHAVTRHPATR